MAAVVAQGQVQGQAGRADMAPVLQQLNLASLRTRTQDLHNAISRILHSFHTQSALKWTEVLGQFAMVNVELLNLVEDIKPILKMFVVYPKNVNAENASILPIMLSSKLLPEMEAEEASMKEQILSGISNLPIHMQSDKIQRQIELVRSVCDAAEKVVAEARKHYGISTRQGPVSLTTLDKGHAARIAEQEKLIRAAANYGEGLRIPPDQQQSGSVLPPHMASALGTSGTDGGLGFQRGSALPPTGLMRPAVPQQQANASQLLGRSTVTNPLQTLTGAGTLPGVGSAATPIPFVNSPRSSTGNFNVPSPQQQQQQQQQPQQQHSTQAALLQRQKQQLQKQQLQVQLQQTQQLRRPGTPPIPQGQVGSQQQGQVAQQHLLQHQQKLQQTQLQQLQQQQYQQHLQAQQERQTLQQLQAQQQQTLHQQLQNSQLQASQQNTLPQANQGRSQMNQLASMNPYGNSQTSLLPSSMIANMNQPGGQSQALLQQRLQQLQGANQSQRILSDPLYSMSNMGLSGTGSQATSTLALPLQQQLAGQANYTGLFNSSQSTGFGQQRQQPPPSQ